MALALELQSRGHEPVIATMNYYREKVQNAGLSFASVRPDFAQPKDQDPELINRLLDYRIIHSVGTAYSHKSKPGSARVNNNETVS